MNIIKKFIYILYLTNASLSLSCEIDRVGSPVPTHTEVTRENIINDPDLRKELTQKYVNLMWAPGNETNVKRKLDANEIVIPIEELFNFFKIMHPS